MRACGCWSGPTRATLRGRRCPRRSTSSSGDASFIGLRTILPAALALAAPGARLVALIKPQFEAGRARVGKGGIVRDAAVHAEVCGAVRDWLTAQGWPVTGLVASPITGRDGNTEFLIAARRAHA